MFRTCLTMESLIKARAEAIKNSSSLEEQSMINAAFQARKTELSADGTENVSYRETLKLNPVKLNVKLTIDPDNKLSEIVDDTLVIRLPSPVIAREDKTGLEIPNTFMFCRHSSSMPTFKVSRK